MKALHLQLTTISTSINIVFHKLILSIANLFMSKHLLTIGFLAFTIPSYCATPDLPFQLTCQLKFENALFKNQNTIRIPFKLMGRLIAVDASIDTVKGTFFFDTGAARLLLNKNYFDGGYPINDQVGYGSTGKMEAVQAKQIDTLAWDNFFRFDLIANLIDLSHIEQKRNSRIIGILGYDVFKDYEVLLDYPFKEIVLTKLDKKGNRLDPNAFLSEPFDSISFKLKNHGIMLEVNIQGQPLTFNLDTGAELNLLDRKVPKQTLKNFKILKRTQLMGAGNKKIEVLAGLLSNVKCGIQPNYPMRTLLTNLNHLNKIFGVKLDGVMGFEFLRPRRTIINYKKKMLYFLEIPKP